MKGKKNFKLFISYSHLDEKHINEFIKHITPLKNNGLIDEWCDRKIIAGKDYQDHIDDNLENADIICLFISANFLSSPACMKEKMNAIELKRKKGIPVIPIILSACGWLDDEYLSKLLALPTDGKPITNFTDSNNAWNIVYEGLKLVIDEENLFNQLQISNWFSSFLQSIELLEKAHPKKEKVLLHDIFVYPELEKFDDLSEYEETIDSEKFIKQIHEISKILLIGENQSGKTTLCKKIITELIQLKYVPIYVSEKHNNYRGKTENLVLNSYKHQYENVSFDKINRKRIIIILDNFHYAIDKEKHINNLSHYDHLLVIVDDIFSLNFKDDDLTKEFIRYRIKEFIPSLRNDLLKKWILLSDKEVNSIQNSNKFYSEIDKKTKLVNTTLGKAIGSGIMPSYPFFILSIMSTFDAFTKPLDQEITSQGYCYQTLIYMYLRKQKVKNDEIGIYLNFLTEFSFCIYDSPKTEISNKKFNIFIEEYEKKYNLPIELELLLENLINSRLITRDNFNNYSFCYEYLYYFFVAKFLAENMSQKKDKIDRIINNLQIDENAYIAIFISHHTKDDYLLDEIILNAYCLFEDFKPATLNKDELKFFDKQVEMVTKALSISNVSPEKKREKRLKEQDQIESKTKKNIKDRDDNDSNDDKLEIELRRSFKTVEVMGRIITNRAGSLEVKKLETIFEEAMKVNLRIISFFIELIKHDEAQQSIIKFISDRINEIIEDKLEKQKKEGKKPRIPSKEELEKISKTLFWNQNFIVVYNLLDKIIYSLGSDKLIRIIETVCDKENTPASFIIKHGILMWFNKNLQVENITHRIDDDGFSKIAKRITKLLIVNYSSMHLINYKEKQKLESKLSIPRNKLSKRKNRDVS